MYTCQSVTIHDLHTHSAASALTSGFANGIGQIWLSNVRCSGTQTRLVDCSHSAFGIHTCSHIEDAGVRCSGTTCTEGAIRLQGGSSIQGRVEICNQNVWGTVCDDFWGRTDARVACTQLGLPSSSELVSCNTMCVYNSNCKHPHAAASALYFGFTNGIGPIWLSNVQCDGTERTLVNCSNSGFGVHTCSHVEDAGVRCTGITCTQAIRLQGGTATQGRVEICNNNVWGTVCDDSWNTPDAIVACRQLGLPSSSE